MHAFVLDPQDPAAVRSAISSIICEEVSVDGSRIFHKGHRIANDDLDRLALVHRTIHVAQLEPGDVHEDEAGMRLAAAVSGPGLSLSSPRQSRVNVISNGKGLLRIDGERLTAINRLPGVLVFSLVDRLAVLPGKILAGAKIAPVAIERSILEEAEAIATTKPIIQVKPFRSLNVGVISTEGLEGRVRERFVESLRKKIDWYGGTILGLTEVENDPKQVAAAIETYVQAGADLVLTGGGDTIDPLDAALLALGAVGAEVVRFGAPVHPGSMFWLAYRGDLPIFNLASCSMYSKATSADLILPWIMAGERVTANDIAELGFGGLLEGKSMSFRFPPYGAEEAAGASE
jgi:probable molybdopterin binding protein